jgi:hypothetical protein
MKRIDSIFALLLLAALMPILIPANFFMLKLMIGGMVYSFIFYVIGFLYKKIKKSNKVRKIVDKLRLKL